MRARDLGIIIGTLSPGPDDAITDVPGVRVGSTTLSEEEPPTINRAPIHPADAINRVPTAGRCASKGHQVWNALRAFESTTK